MNNCLSNIISSHFDLTQIHDDAMQLFQMFTQEYIVRFVQISSTYLDYFKMKGGITYKIARLSLTTENLLINVRPHILYIPKFRKNYETVSSQLSNSQTDSDSNSESDIEMESEYQSQYRIHVYKENKKKRLNKIIDTMETKQINIGTKYFNTLKIKKNNKFIKVNNIEEFLQVQYEKIHNKGKYPISQKAKQALVKCIEYDLKYILKSLKNSTKENELVTGECLYDTLDKLNMRIIL